MALKAVLSKEEHAALPEATRAFYVEKDGKFLLDAEGVEDVTGLKNALEAVRGELKSAKKSLQDTIDKFKDIDPEKAKEAQRKLQEIEDKQLLDAGKVDELLKVRTERMKADYDNQISAFNKNIDGLKREVSEANKTVAEVLIDNSIRSAAIKAGITEAAVDDVVLRGQRLWTLKNKQPVAIKDDQIIYGKDPNKPITIDEWVGGLQQEAPHLFKASAGAGTPPNQGGGGNPRSVRLSREEAKDPQKYRAAKAQAEKAGVPLEVVG